VQKLEETLRKVIADPDVNAKLKAMAVDPGGGPSAEFRAMIDKDITTTAEVVKAAKLEFNE
jgi:tripartite-type tricarboxylate transporter receptor subunit TctC